MNGFAASRDSQGEPGESGDGLGEQSLRHRPQRRPPQRNRRAGALREADSITDARPLPQRAGRDGETLLSRIQGSGYLSGGATSYLIGEDIAYGTGALATPAAIVRSWTTSPEDLANLLGPYLDAGTAVAVHLPPGRADGQAGAIYTQVIGRSA